MSNPRKGNKTIYDGVIFRKREGSITLSGAGLAYRSTDDAECEGQALKYRARWGVIAKWTLNKRSSPKALMKVIVLLEGNELEHVTFRLASREILEELRDDMDARKQRFDEKQAAAAEASNNNQAGDDPPVREEPSESMDDSAFHSSSARRWSGVRQSQAQNYQDSMVFEESIRLDGSDRLYHDDPPSVTPVTAPAPFAIPDDPYSNYGTSREEEYELVAERKEEEHEHTMEEEEEVNPKLPPSSSKSSSMEEDMTDTNERQDELTELPSSLHTQDFSKNMRNSSHHRERNSLENSWNVTTSDMMESDDEMSIPHSKAQEDEAPDTTTNRYKTAAVVAGATGAAVGISAASQPQHNSNMIVPVPVEQDIMHVDYDQETAEAPRRQQQALIVAPPTTTNQQIAMNSQTANPMTASQMSGPLIPVIASRTNLNGSVYGTSKYFTPTQGARLVAEAEFYNFAPCHCVCYEFCVNEKMRKRTYVRIYENRTESNLPWAPFFCCSDERCMEDNVQVLFFDRMPHRSGMCCKCIPCVCCGPPVVYALRPACCCGLIKTSSCFGEQIMYAAYDCFDLRIFLCCGSPCYTCWSLPVFPALGVCQAIPMTNSNELLSKWKGALMRYRAIRKIGDGQGAVFKGINDNFCECDSVKEISPVHMDPRGSIQGMYLDPWDGMQLPPQAARMEDRPSSAVGGSSKQLAPTAPMGSSTMGEPQAEDMIRA
ncbi:expressed unknown protein [Seminavis robusta]|uniref:Uncharacterized protein n=1 Tax=Seminavis robusta TaxID=568900 RepID=A0A9N8EE66_9STRA|nr:expressed unknown protein [Seminavis robusta]|eukprot:Sro1049_g235430.1 n/a (715) ;mRNA; r:28211-30355